MSLIALFPCDQTRVRCSDCRVLIFVERRAAVEQDCTDRKERHTAPSSGTCDVQMSEKHRSCFMKEQAMPASSDSPRAFEG